MKVLVIKDCPQLKKLNVQTNSLTILDSSEFLNGLNLSNLYDTQNPTKGNSELLITEAQNISKEESELKAQIEQNSHIN